MVSTTSSCINDAVIAVYVPAAFTNVRMPNSFNISLLGAGVFANAFVGINPAATPVPMGNILAYLSKSLLFIFLIL